MDSKVCRHCGNEFTRPKNVSHSVFVQREFCSMRCYGAGRRKPSQTKPCAQCGEPFRKEPRHGEAAWQRRRFCSTACAYAFRKGKKRGADHHAWKGGRTVDPSGYVRVVMRDDHPFVSMRLAYGYVQEHRLVVADHLGRPLHPWETVHHRNGVRDDNRIENLELRTGRHGAGAELCCADCGSRNLIPC